MKYSELSFFEFLARFPDEKSCENALEKARWPDGFKCPHCGNNKAYQLTNRIERQCSKCGTQTSLTAGTVFHNTRTPLLKWFWAIYLVSQDKGGVAALRLSKQLELGYKTAWLMLHKIRKAMGNRDSQYQLHGLVEVDEAFFGGVRRGLVRKYNTIKTRVVVMVESREHHAGYLAMNPFDKEKGETFKNIVKRNVVSGATIKTDGNTGYNVLSKEGYVHQSEVVPQRESCNLLPWVHLAISNAKCFILGTYHGVSHKHLLNYLNEYCYRFNRRWNESQLASRLINACANSETITYADLRG